MAITDYIGRQYDYLALRTNSGGGQVGLELFNAQTAGEICVGIQKLSQRWALEFLTIRGSLPFLPTRGSDFMATARAGSINSALSAFTAFAQASIGVAQNLRNEETDDMPPDERYGDAELLSVSFLPGYLNMTIGISSLSGATRKLILPIATLPDNV